MLRLDAKTRDETIRYLLVGVLTSGVNLTTFFVLEKGLGVNYLVSNSAAWVATVVVAYVADKLLVFRSGFTGLLSLLREFSLFVGSRLFSGAVDMLLMWGLVAGLGLGSDLVKLLNSAVVVALNYLLSKLFIFRDAAE